MDIDINFKDIDDMKKDLELLKMWYNRHWFYDKDVLLQEAKKIAADHLDVKLVV